MAAGVPRIAAVSPTGHHHPHPATRAPGSVSTTSVPVGPPPSVRAHAPGALVPSGLLRRQVAEPPRWPFSHLSSVPRKARTPSAPRPPTSPRQPGRDRRFQTEAVLCAQWAALNPTASRQAVPGGTSMTQISEADLFNYLLSICSGCTLARKSPEIGKLKLKKIFFFFCHLGISSLA